MTKNKIILILIAVCSSLILSTSYAVKKLSDAKERGKKLENTISSLDKKLKTFQVTMDDSIKLYAATVEDLSMTKKNLQSKCNDLMKELKIKPKEIHHYSKIETCVHDTIRVVAEVDSFGGLNAVYKDDFAKINVNIDTARNAVIDYAIKDSLTLFNHQKKHSLLFGLIKWYETEKTTIVSHNPKAVISDFKSINIIQ